MYNICIHILAINTGVRVSFQISVFCFFGYIYPRMELLHHMVVLFLVFCKSSILFSTMAVLIYSSKPTVYKDSVFFTSLPILVICVLSDDSHSDRCEVISLVLLICFSLIINSVEHMKTIFSCACWSSVCLLWKKSIQVFCPAFSQFFFCFFLILTYMNCVYILDINPSHIICTYFLPFSKLSFHFVSCFLFCAEVFKFN